MSAVRQRESEADLLDSLDLICMTILSELESWLFNGGIIFCKIVKHTKQALFKHSSNKQKTIMYWSVSFL